MPATDILGILVTPIVEVAKCLIGPVGEKLGQILHYQKNIKNLQEQVEALKRTKESVEKAVEEARQRNQIIKSGVSEWLKKVQVIESEAQNILEKSVLQDTNVNRSSCFNCLNLSSRYKLSKEAVLKAGAVSELQSEGKFNSISDPNPDVASASRPPPPIDLLRERDFEAFESTTRAMNEVMSGLKEQKTHVIGVYGMGGIGKTTLVKQIGKRVKDDFEEVIIATVSQKPDLKRIQGEIAEGLGKGKQLQEESKESDSVRARWLTSWLKDKSVLIILDDLWDRVDLGELGIPNGADNSGCKVVFTTRSLDVCNSMYSHMNVEVQVLSDQDSWNLFRKVAEDVDKSSEFCSVAKEVVQECGGLPIALVTLGRALRNRQDRVWRNALRELKISEPTTIWGMSQKVFSCIKLSFDYLQSEEAKLCFLYCSLFPEDYDVKIEDLVRYTFGDGLLSNDENLMDWRNKIHVIVDDLISCCLLLKGKWKGYARMHDVVRDVAISISNEKGFMVKARTGLKEWPKGGRLEHVTRMSLMDNEIEKISDTVECPKLEVLLLQNNYSLGNIADNFFSGMDSLKVFDISKIRISSLPHPLFKLAKLKTLQCNGVRMKEIAIIGELRELEILSLQNCLFEEIPQQLGCLTKLKLLDLSYSRVGIFPKNILSNLSQLEELYMARSFSQWEVEDSKSKGQANLSEFFSLKKLTALHIDITNCHCLFKDNSLGCWKNLQNFCISVSERDYPVLEENKGPMCLQYSGSVNNLKNAAEWMKGLMKKTKKLSLVGIDGERIDELSADGLTECLERLFFNGGTITAVCSCKYLKGLRRLESLILYRCSDLKAVFLNSDDHENPETNTLPSLKNLLLGDLDGLESVIKGYSPSPPLCFTNLQSLSVRRCKSVTALFRPEIAKTLQQLSHLEISQCPRLRSIISYLLDKDNLPRSHRLTQEEMVIAFPKLTYIGLSDLSNFEYFSEPPIEVSFPALKELRVRNCHYASSFTEQYKSVVHIVM